MTTTTTATARRWPVTYTEMTCASCGHPDGMHIDCAPFACGHDDCHCEAFALTGRRGRVQVVAPGHPPQVKRRTWHD